MGLPFLSPFSLGSLFLAAGMVAACTSSPWEDNDATAADDDVTAADDDAAGDDGGKEDDDTTAAADADGDGSPDDTDCDDGNPGIHPGAQEVCDGVDQDCDGEADDGIPHDPSGCSEPTPPVWDDAVDIVHLTIRSGSGTYDGTDSYQELCLSGTACFSLDKPEWNDNEAGVTEVWAFEGAGLSRASLDRLTLQTDDGSDLWRPTCVAVSLDGEPFYCRDGLTVEMGDETDETLSWTDPEGLGIHCLGCFDTPLTHGPLLGPTEPDGPRLWFRTDSSRRTVLRVAPNEGELTTAPPTHIAWPEASADFTHAVKIAGLSPASTWAWDLEIEGMRHGPWSFTTAPEAGSSSPGGFRFAFGSCTSDDDQPIFSAIAAQSPDLFLFIGDNHYGNTGDLSSLRQNYRWAHERPLRREMQAATPTLATWDDHDYTGNNEDGTAPEKDVAVRVFTEYWANPSYGTEETSGIFTHHRVGDVEFFLVDDRYFRGMEDSMLGEAQEEWLLSALEESTAVFKFIACGSQWTLDGSDDSWANFPDSQTRFREALVDREIGGVVLMSGDVHRSEFRLLEGADGGYSLPELTSSPLANSNSGCPDEDEILACFDDRDLFITVDVDTAAPDPTVEAVIFDGNGTSLATWTLLRSELGM